MTRGVIAERSQAEPESEGVFSLATHHGPFASLISLRYPNPESRYPRRRAAARAIVIARRLVQRVRRAGRATG